MFGDKNIDFWRVLRPSKWPEAPSWMSFSTLIELEICPRRWALVAADYSDIWNNRGYPPIPQTSALEGTIVHLSLRKITDAFVENNCSSLADENAILTLRKLGGYTVIVMDNLERVLLPYRENPRAFAVLDGIRTRLTSKVPELRTRVQRHLARIRPEPRAIVHSEATNHPVGEPRRALQHGTYTELLLKSSKLGWRGVADMLTLTTTQCEIRDFKTGFPKEEHKIQLWIYALLWTRDVDLNPSGRLADKFVLSYYERDEEIPAPDAKELRSLEDELRQRTAMALAYLQTDQPEPRLSSNSCKYCTVRQLCDEYWRWQTQKRENNELANSQFIDVQCKVCNQHGPSSWDCVVEFGPGIQVEKPLLLRSTNLPFPIRSGQRIRLLNVYINSPDEESNEDRNTKVVVNMNANSEVFLLE